MLIKNVPGNARRKIITISTLQYKDGVVIDKYVLDLTIKIKIIKSNEKN